MNPLSTQRADAQGLLSTMVRKAEKGRKMSLCDKKNTMMVLVEFLKLLLKQVSLGLSDESIFSLFNISVQKGILSTLCCLQTSDF